MANVRTGTGCELCGHSRHATRYRLDSIHVVECQECGLVFADPSTHPLQQGELYDAAYFQERAGYFLNCSGTPTPGPSGEHIARFQDGLRLLEGYGKAGELLDVGCAVGIFLRMAEEAGWRVQGVDVSAYATSIARRACRGNVHTGELTQIGFPKGFFDVVTLWDVVEHFVHPKSVLSEVHRILKDDGLILLDTPNEGCLIRRAARGLYRLSRGRLSYPARKLYHAYHLYYFSESTLRTLLEQCGFEILRMFRKPIPREKGRGTPLERAVVKVFSLAEKPLGMDFELFTLARKKTQSIEG